MNNEAIENLSTLNNDTEAFLPRSAWQLMLQDIKGGLQQWRIWLILSWQDIRIRYRRSQLGPFWLTISMAITIYTMGLLYGHLFKFEIRNYFPYLAAGMLTWNMVSLLISEGTNAFVGAEHFIKQIKVPYSVFVMRVICRNLIIFAHTIIVVVPLFFIFHIKVTPAILMFIPGMLLLILNAFFFGLVLAIIGARYRDVAQLITSVIQVIFFLTPIMWNPAFLPEKYQHWVMLNPFMHLIEIVRAPMMSTMPAWYSFVFVCVLTVLGALLACYLLAKTRDRIIYWL
jgi:lipopolysaccharide transport system permease protein